jgi:DNA polymerase-4
VTAASYEVRPFGVRSAMSMVQALELCPHAIVVEPRHGRYAEVSREFFAILDRYSPAVEGLSLDEAFLDVTGEERLYGDGEAIARRIKADVRRELSLVVSVGVAPVKFAAKIASDVGKPDGLVCVERVREFLAPLPIGRLWGVGRVTEEALRSLGLRTIGDVAVAGASLLATKIGRDSAHHLVALANGEDPRRVEPDREAVSIGSEDTFERDVRDRELLAEELLAQADRVCARVRDQRCRARTITVKVKYANHELVTRRTTLARATADGRVVGEATRALLANVPDIERRGVRLTGVSLSALESVDAPRQLGFDEAEHERGERLGAALDEIAAKFGHEAVKRAVHVDKDPRDRAKR